MRLEKLRKPAVEPLHHHRVGNHVRQARQRQDLDPDARGGGLDAPHELGQEQGIEVVARGDTEGRCDPARGGPARCRRRYAEGAVGVGGRLGRLENLLV